VFRQHGRIGSNDSSTSPSGNVSTCPGRFAARSVHGQPQLYEAVATFARREKLSIAAHVAESQEETALVRDGAGPFAEALRSRGIMVQPQHRSPVAYLVQRGVVQRGTLCIHCVQVDEADVTLLRNAGPRSPTARVQRSASTRETAARCVPCGGVPVGLGTDSVVSVGELTCGRKLTRPVCAVTRRCERLQ